jgi:hypothetical protein
MKKRYNNTVFQAVMIACLGVALLFGQTFKVHMHIQHDENPSSAGHSTDVHVASSQHDTIYDTQHQDDFQAHQHPAEIDVSSSSFVKKVEWLTPVVLLFFLISIILCAPQLCRFHRRHNSKKERPPNYYLLHPPLRAPPSPG